MTCNPNAEDISRLVLMIVSSDAEDFALDEVVSEAKSNEAASAI